MFNLPTPAALRQDLNEIDPEFGRMAERIFFREAINWTKTFKSGAVSATYLTNFVKAIEDNTELPTFPTDTKIIPRKGPILMRGGGGGLDIEEEHEELE
ncbi:hypothetical protein HA402_014045 [Bradysia odoriphaga]|nr:hypothetical protein HA402_014045 [Bradysia odoriphaga]